MRGLGEIIPWLVGIAAFVVIVELLFIIAWRIAPLHAGTLLDSIGARSGWLRSHRHVIASFIGWRLASAPSANIRRRVAELFPPTLLTDPRPSVRWQVWYNAHIPAFIARATPPRHASRVIGAVFDGLCDATRALVTGPAGQTTHIAFDHFWPILESIEEIAAHTPPATHGCFADKLLELCTATNDETVQAATGWLVNELHERTPNERQLSGVVVGCLRVAAPHASRVAMGLVEKFTKNLEMPVSVAGARGAAAVDSQLALFESARVVASEQILEVGKKTDAEQFFRDLCDTGKYNQQPLLGINGLTWMVLQRAAFKELCDQKQPSEFLQAVCEAAMACAEERHTCAFLVIEALEPIRDRLPEACVAAMCKFLGSSAGKFDQAVAVCVSEGFEEGSGGATFTRSARRWLPRVDTPYTRLGIAAQEVLKQSGKTARLQPMVGWMNLRLDLHESAERRSAKWPTAAVSVPAEAVTTDPVGTAPVH